MSPTYPQVTGLLVGTVAALAGWYIGAYLTYIIGTKLFTEPQTSADHGELLRTLGFACAPGVIRILGVVPSLTAITFFVASVWMLAATVWWLCARLLITKEHESRDCVFGWMGCAGGGFGCDSAVFAGLKGKRLA